MEVAKLIGLVANLAEVEGRAQAALALAAELGAEQSVVLLHDTETCVMLPAAGLRKTLPGGDEWRQLLERSREPGVHRASVPWRGGDPPLSAVACSSGGVALVLVGGSVSDLDARLVCSLMSILRAALRAQQESASAAGELKVARAEIRQASTLMQALDDTRAQLDRSLVERDRQARSLEQARARAEEATRSKDEFMAMLGHELRNPLSPMSTALDLLQMRGIWSQEHDIMRRQLRHMIRLVDDLLDVSRIAGGKLTLQLAPIEIGAVISRSLETSAPLFAQRRQVVCVDVPAEGLRVNGDAPRLEQVFSNLLTNASKYSDTESRIDVTIRREGDVVRVTVQDRGIGIDQELLDEVFTLFHQQGRGLDRAQGGLGLGLAIVRNLVGLHGGSVEAFSDGPGKGSSFVVELPLLADSLPVVVRPVAQATPRARVAARILLVDDNADARETLALALRNVGHEVRVAPDGPEALVAVDVFAPDVAVLDIGLPVMDGYELAGRLHRRDGPPIRLIAVTGYGQAEDQKRARAAGFCAHLVKPVKFELLLATIDDAIGQGEPPLSGREVPGGTVPD